MTFLREAFPFDEIAVEMSLAAATERSAALHYEFVRRTDGSSEKVAAGRQQLVWVRRTGGEVHSEPFPAALRLLLASGGARERRPAALLLDGQLR
jgi:acyl-CoA thioesterase FadM